MTVLKTIKNKLLYGLKDALFELIDEDLTTVLELKKNGLPYAIKRIKESKQFKDLSLIAHAIMLSSANKEIKEKLDHKNSDIFKECFRLSNAVTFQNVMKKYFEPSNIQDLKEINSINDIEYNIIKVDDASKNIFGFEVLEAKLNTYRNPYTQTELILSSSSPYSYIKSHSNFENRTKVSTINVAVLEQPQLMYSDEKTYSGLINHFTLNEINKFEVEFTLFHELAHAAIKINYPSGRDDESISDLCGAIKVIKNNNMTLDQAVDYIDHRISFRCQDAVLRFHSNKFSETDRENEDDIRIHATQLSLLTLKDMIQKDYDFVKTLNTSEELVLASNLTRFSTNDTTLQTIREREFYNKKEYEDISIDTWINSDVFIQFFEKLAIERKTTSKELIENLKTNISGNIDKLFDVMTAYQYMTYPSELKNLETYSIMAADATRNFLFHEMRAAIPVNLKPNFSDKDLEAINKKQRNNPSNLFS